MKGDEVPTLPSSAPRGVLALSQTDSISGWLLNNNSASSEASKTASSIQKVTHWQAMAGGGVNNAGAGPAPHRLATAGCAPTSGFEADNNLPYNNTQQQGLGKGLCRGRTPSFEALKGAVTDLYRLDDFNTETLGAGFFSDVYKVVHKTSGKVMVLKMNKYRSNRNNSLREIQLMNRLKHPNILRFEAVCVHEGQLHALTEYISGGNLEQLVKDDTKDLPWATRMELSLHVAKGLMYLNSQGFFHRDLTSKNILIKTDGTSTRRFEHIRDEKCVKLTAVIGDFGLATRIPKKDSPRLPQVGSPYWMSPECLRGERYDHQADIFSFGIISCELIARCDADPDVLPRTQNFGVDYRAFSEMCGTCPPEYLKVAFTCLSIDPSTRPRSNELVSELKSLLEDYHRLQHHHQSSINATVSTPLFSAAAVSSSSLAVGSSSRSQLKSAPAASTCFSAAALRHSRLQHHSGDSDYISPVRKSPSEKARIHSRHNLTVKSVGEEMCLKDPHYTPRNSISVNPFALLPRLREGRKLVGSTVDLFSSCFEMPSPRVASPTNPSCPSRSLPSSPTNVHKELPGFNDDLVRMRSGEQKPVSSSHVSTLKKLYSARGFLSQDDSVLGLSSSPSFWPLLDGYHDEMNRGGGSGLRSNLKRWGSVESGVYSVSEDWFESTGGGARGEQVSSTRSICSSLLTVSDLEEDLRMASQFLARKRSSSVFTDSLDDLSTRLDELSNTGTSHSDIKALERGYEKDIRDIVEYFERNCVADKKETNQGDEVDTRSSPEIARSQKIQSLILAVAENKNNRAARLRRGTSPISPPQHLQVCNGIVQSKLQIFDHTKRRQPRPRFEQNGFVKARRAIFDVPNAVGSNTSKSTVVSGGVSTRKHFSGAGPVGGHYRINRHFHHFGGKMSTDFGGKNFTATTTSTTNPSSSFSTGAIPKKFAASSSTARNDSAAERSPFGGKFSAAVIGGGSDVFGGKTGSKLTKLVEQKEAKVEK